MHAPHRRLREAIISGPLAVLVGAWLVAASGAAAQAPPSGQGPPGGRGPWFARDDARLVDLTYAFDSTTVYWPTAKPFRLEVVAHGKTPGGFFYASNNICASEHGGTHMDAPIHFADGRWTADEIPVDRFIGPAVVIDVGDSVGANSDYRLRVDDVKRWEKAHGRIPDGAIILMRTGWGSRWPDKKRYFGTDTPSDTKTLHFPGFSREAAEFLTFERRPDAVGLDAPSLDYGPSQDFIAHRVFSAANVPGFENVAHLEKLPEQGATLIALPMKIGGGTGGPVRILGALPPPVEEALEPGGRGTRGRGAAPSDTTMRGPRWFEQPVDALRSVPVTLDRPTPAASSADEAATGDERIDYVAYDEPPVRLSVPRLVYPSSARKLGIRGTVRVRALVGEQGRVVRTRVVRSVPRVERAAVDWVKGSRWRAARANGRPVAVWVEVPVRFPPGRPPWPKPIPDMGRVMAPPGVNDRIEPAAETESGQTR